MRTRRLISSRAIALRVPPSDRKKALRSSDSSMPTRTVRPPAPRPRALRAVLFLRSSSASSVLMRWTWVLWISTWAWFSRKVKPSSSIWPMAS